MSGSRPHKQPQAALHHLAIHIIWPHHGTTNRKHFKTVLAKSMKAAERKDRALRSAVSCLPPSTEASERRRGSSPGVSGTVPQNVFVFQPKVLFFLFYLLRILGNLPGFALARTAAHPFPSNALLVSCFYIYISQTIEHPQEQAPYFIFPFAPTKIFPQI